MIRERQRDTAGTLKLRHAIILVSLIGIYLIGFPPLYRLTGPGAGALSLLPVLGAGWLFGRRAAVATWVVILVLNTLLLNLAGVPGWDAVFRVGGGAGIATVLIAGVAAGWVRDLVARTRSQAGELAREREALRHEIAQRTAAEAALREQQEHLQLLSTQTPAILWATDRDLRFTSSVGGGLAGLGLMPHEVVGRSLFDFFQTDDPDFLPIAISRRALQGEQVTFEGHWGGNNYQVQVAPLFDADGQVIGTVGTALDISQRKHSEAAVRRRDSILDAVSFAAARFLETDSWEQQIDEVLARLGTAADVSRVYLFQNDPADGQALLTSQRYEWVAPGVTPQIANQELQSFSFQVGGFARWQEYLQRGELIHGHVRSFPEAERSLLASHDIASIVVVPILVNQSWWGHIGFDQCRSEREWSVAEIDALKTAAGILGATIQREQAAATLRYSERRYRDLFAAAQRQAQELALLDQVRNALARELDLMVVFRLVVEATREHLGYTHVSLYLLQDGMLQLQHQVGYNHVIWRLPITDGVMGRVARNGVAELLEDVRSEPVFVEAIAGIVSEICIPLFDQGQVVGVLNVETSDGATLGTADLRLVQAIGAHVSSVIERARLHSIVRESEQRYRSVVDSLKEVVFQTNMDGIWTFLNPAWTEITSFTIEETLGRRWSEYVHPDDHALARELFAPLYRRESTECHGVVRFLTRDGGLRWIEFQARLTPGEGNSLLGVSGTISDITERKRAETERVALERKLQETQKLESLGVLAGGIAHDFNNLLMAILGNAELALLDLPAGAPARESITQIEAAAHRAADLTSQMLAYAGKGSLLLQPLDLNALVTEISALVHVSLAKATSLRYQLGEVQLMIEGDAAQLRQVLINLVSNAAEALGAAEGVITISTGLRYVDQQYLASTWLAPALPPGEYVFLEVADTGQGMDEATLARIFDPFFTTKFAGRGLGLPAVLGIVRGHHGALKVSSASAQGTTFTILLPSSSHARQSAAALGDAGAAMAPALKPALPVPATALVVDDEEGVRSVAARMLERSGFSVLTANDGQAAVELFGAHADSIAVVLLDLTMPRMNGEEALRAIRGIRPDARILIMSGYDEQGLAERFVDVGPVGFLQKPFTPSVLQEKVRNAML